MIGKITLLIITIFILMTMLVSFMTVVNGNIIESHLYEYVSSYAEKISMEGVISSGDFLAVQDRLMSLGGYEAVYKYSRRIGPDLYSIETDPSGFIGRDLNKGDMINIVVIRHNSVIFNKTAYVMVNKQEYFMGYEVIRDISGSTVPIYVRNKGQAEYIIYDGSNPYYGDDAIEMPYGEGYIFEYSKYIKREGYSNGELTDISYTEY